jgi:hypothetical protein
LRRLTGPIPPMQLGGDGVSAPPPSDGMSLEQAADVLGTVLDAYWFHVLGVCVHLGISGELASDERLRAAEYGLLLSPRPGIALMFLRTCATVRPGIVG